MPIKSISSKPAITWRKGCNARFHYTAHAYIAPKKQPSPPSESPSNGEGENGNDCKDSHCHEPGHHHHHQHAHHDKKCSCSGGSEEARTKKMNMIKDLLEKSTQKKKSSAKKEKKETDDETPLDPNLKPVRTLISDSRKNDPNPFELRIGYSFSVTAMEISVKSMKVGEKARFLCMPQYCDSFIQLETILRQEKLNKDLAAAGKPLLNFSGCSAHMSPEMMEISKGLEDALGSTLEFEIELISVQEPNSFEKEAWEMSADEKFAEVPITKQKGADLYRVGDWEGSLKKYERCLVLLETLSTSGIVLDMKKEASDLRRGVHSESIVPKDTTINLDTVDEWTRMCRLNHAACKLKLRDYPSVIIQCTEVLKTDPRNIKALFRRGQAYVELGRDLDLAARDFDTLSLLCRPDTAEFQELISQQKKLDIKVKKHLEKEKSMYAGKLFS